MADPLVDELNATTLQEIYPRTVEDNFFLDTPFLAYLRAHSLKPFTGGAFMQSTFLYAPLIGGSYAKGDNFNITKRQTLSSIVVKPKYYQVSIPEYKEELLVENQGPEAVFSLIKLHLDNAMSTICSIIAIAIPQHGQNLAGSDRVDDINGLEEALNDGTTPSWQGNVFTSYGNQARNGVVKSALNSTPIWCGNADGTTAPISYKKLEEGYQAASIGRKSPKLGVCNKSVYAYIKERIQPQQRFAQERDPYFGATGMKMNDAMILKDDYWPSLVYGLNDPDLGNYLTGTFNSPASPNPASGLPGSTLIHVGETFAWLRPEEFALRIANNREYGFGFEGFIPASDNTRVVGRIKAAVNLQCFSNRLQRFMYGIGG